MIGATFQVLAHGVPQDASIVYSATCEEVGEAGSGLITGLQLGDCSKAVSQDGDMVYSQNTVLVIVVPLSGVRIASAIKRLVEGTAMPLYLVGTGEGQDVYSWASAVPNIEVDWGMKCDGGVEGVFHGAGLDIIPVNELPYPTRRPVPAHQQQASVRFPGHYHHGESSVHQSFSAQ